jgi:hypothetical protein
MDVGTLRKVLKRYGHWRRLQDHVTMLSETEGAPIGRAITNEEQKRLLETVRETFLVTQIFTSWNSLISWPTRIDSFRLAA